MRIFLLQWSWKLWMEKRRGESRGWLMLYIEIPILAMDSVGSCEDVEREHLMYSEVRKDNSMEHPCNSLILCSWIHVNPTKKWPYFLGFKSGPDSIGVRILNLLLDRFKSFRVWHKQTSKNESYIEYISNVHMNCLRLTSICYIHYSDIQKKWSVIL